MKKLFDCNKEKRDMMELWKETFHDSSRYIDLVFDTYYHPDNAFTVYDGEKLIAALLGVEYEFQTQDESGHKKVFKGMYLCGIATHPDYRRQGIMANLMKEAENSAKERGFSLTFLIPADTHLRRYYEKKGYHTASYRRCQYMESVPLTGQNRMHIYTFRKLFEEGKIGFIRNIAQWCCEREKNSGHVNSILHSREDMVTIMSENENSFFFTDSTFDLEYPILAKVRGVVFPTPSEDERGKVWRIVGLFLQDNESYISSDASKINLSLNIRETLQIKFPKCRFELSLPYTGREHKKVEKEPYAMIKSIINDGNFAKFDNQTFKIYLMLD